MKKLLILLIICSVGMMSKAQNTMNIYQNNGTVLQIPLSTIDSITYTLGNPGNVASITTLPIGNITASGASSGGNITNDGGSPVTQRGICWSTSLNPTTANTSTSNGSGVGSFVSSLTGLTANTTYYVRAYAINNAGTAYGNQVSFTTVSNVLATLTTQPVSNIGETSVSTGGNITNIGASPVTQRGVVFGTNPNPTISNSMTNDGLGMGGFTSNPTGLTGNTTYYLRAYATNSGGTAYGNQITFTTLIPAIVTNPGAGVSFDGYTYTSIVLGNGQEWMVENLRTAIYANGDTIPNVTDSNQWIFGTGAWKYYCNLANVEPQFGKLYNWYAVADPRNVCPTGWHAPTDTEWTVFTDYLGGQSVAGGKMKSTAGSFTAPNTGATNESGFSGLAGGEDGGTSCQHASMYGYFWSSTNSQSVYAWYRSLSYTSASCSKSSTHNATNLSVRCLRD